MRLARIAVQSRLERGAFRVAKYLDSRREYRGRQEIFRATREIWWVEAGIPRAMLAIGTTDPNPLSATLLGIRLGTSELRFITKIDTFPAEVAVSHDQISDGLKLTVRSLEPFDDPSSWPHQTAFYCEYSLTGRCADRAVRLAEVGISNLGYDSDIGNHAVGHVGSIVLGDESIASSHWSAYLLGLNLGGASCQGKLGDAEVSLGPIPPEVRWSGLAARARKIPQNRFWRIMESATWRRPAVPSGFPQLVKVDLSFPSPVTAEVAERFLLDDLCWLLDLYAGRRVVLIGPWDSDERCGLLKDLGRPLVSLKTGVLGSGVMIQEYLAAVLPTWESMTDDQRRDVRIGIAILRVLPPELEAAVVIGAMGLEHLANALLPRTKEGYDLSPSQIAQVRIQLQSLAETIASGSDWLKDLSRLDGRLFQRPAPDRIEQLCQTYGVAVEEGEIKAYAATRNPVTHGRLPKVTTEQKIRAMLFERHAIAACLLRRLGFDGAIYDVRRAGRYG